MAVVIFSFRHKGIDALYHVGSTRGVQAAHATKLRRILAALDTAAGLEGLRQPAYRLHPLKGPMRDR